MTEPDDGPHKGAAEAGFVTAARPQAAFVIYPDVKSAPRRRMAEHGLAEAVSLAAALPRIVLGGAQVVRLAQTHPATLFGSGKVIELGTLFKDGKIDLVLIDGVVSPVQQRNLEKAWGVKILDRMGLILEVFADRARTREGVLQVELAQLAYQRTRLVRAWTHLERQRGGFGFVGGPGETQKESDRRAIDGQMIRLRRQLQEVTKTRALHRAARRKVPFPLMAIVGYTNAGKSTLFNRLTGAAVLAQDMLFATLDPTMRAISLPSGRKIITSDTVGFISDLPTDLVAAFRATLEEVLEADMILHVRDISHPDTAEQAADVQDILAKLGVKPSVPVIEVWNKADLLPPDQAALLAQPENRRKNCYLVSAQSGAGLDGLLDAVALGFADTRLPAHINVPFHAGRARAWLHDAGVITQEDNLETSWDISVLWRDIDAARFAAAFPDFA